MKAPAFPLYAKDLVMDTLTLTAEEFGAYVRLLCNAWSGQTGLPQCHLPLSEAELAILAGMSLRRWRRISGKVLRYFEVSDLNTYFNRRLLAELQKQQDFRESRSKNAQARWNARASDSDRGSNSIPDALQFAVCNLQSSDSAAAEVEREREGEERVGDPTRNPDSPAREAELDEPTAEDLAIGEYVAAIERAWTAQGGSILLRNEDWRLAQAWHREGRPLHLVLEAIGLVFARRRDRGEADRVNSLRYLAQEIDKQWRLWRQMTATGERDANSPELDLPARLRNLSLAAPADLAPRILELRAEADSEAVEAALSALDAKMLGSARESLAADQEAEIRTAIQRTLDSFGNRLDPEGVVTTRERLWATLLRDRLYLPHLSLFSPEARAVEAVADPPRHDAGEDSSPRSPADVFTGADRRLEEGP